MPPLPPIRRLALPAVIWTAAGLAACGNGASDKKLLSRSASSRLTATLDQVQRLVDEGDCEGAQAEAGQLRQQVGALPSRVDVDLRNTVITGANRLERLIAGQCTAAPTTSVPAQPQESQPEENGNGKQKKPKKQKGNNGNQGTTGPAEPEQNPSGDGGSTGNGGSLGTGGNGSEGD